MRFVMIVLTVAGLSSGAVAQDTAEPVVGLTVESYEALREDLNQINPSYAQQLAFMGVNSGMATMALSMNLTAEAHYGRKFFCLPPGAELNDELAETVMSLALANYDTSGFNDRTKDRVSAGTLFLSALIWQFPCD